MGPGVSTQMGALPVERRKRGLHRLEERCEALHLELAVEIGHGARQREAVLERVARARRCLGAVTEHPPIAIRGAPDIDRAEAHGTPRGATPTSGRRNSGLPATTAAGNLPSRTSRAGP